MCVRNVEKQISKCIESILNQTFTDFEIVLIDDNSFDKTKYIINNFKDKRLRYFKNREWRGISKSRNLSVKYAEGEYVFFTDGDCVVSPDWLEQGLKFLKNSDCAGVEGKSYYITENYKPTFSDHTYSMGRGKFMTGNIAYKRRIVESVGGFDERYSYFEDRDLGFRIRRKWKIGFNPNMNVFIQKENITFKRLLRHGHIIKNRVYLFKRFHDKELISWRIVDIRSLIKILCPPSVFASLFINKFETLDEYNLIPFTYANAILERLRLWRECAKERVFLI